MRISFSKSVTESLLAKIRSGEMMSRNEKFNLIIQLSIPSILAQVNDSSNVLILMREWWARWVLNHQQLLDLSNRRHGFSSL